MPPPPLCAPALSRPAADSPFRSSARGTRTRRAARWSSAVQRRGPRLFPRGRVLEGDLVAKRAPVGAGEPLDQFQVLARAAPRGLAGEVGGFHDQRVALPVSARAAQPLAWAVVGHRAAVDRDDAHLVDHLQENRHVAFALEDLDVVVVDAAQPYGASRQTPFPQTAVFVRVSPPPLSTGPPAFAGPRYAGRNPPIGWVDDQRGATIGLPAVPPELVVGEADIGLRAQLAATFRGGERFGVQVRLGDLLRGQKLASLVSGRALHRGRGAVVPDAFQVGGTPGHARRRGRVFGS